ncbi:MAG: alanyl-tRNA editing protein [Lautropia sp.]
MTEPLFRDQPYLKSTTATVTGVREGVVHTDRTVFYPAGGGQAGDSGTLRCADGRVLRIVDTRKGDAAAGDPPDAISHRLEEGASPPQVGETVTLALDWERRYAMMKLHTCLHVLSCVVVAPVTGGNIAPDKGRLDFDIDMSLLDAQRITDGVNALIARAVPTETVWITDEALDARPELVKTMSVSPPRGTGRVRLLKIEGIDLQPCGGTHVANIGEIGRVKVTRIRSEGKRNKRVEIVLDPER